MNISVYTLIDSPAHLDSFQLGCYNFGPTNSDEGNVICRFSRSKVVMNEHITDCDPFPEENVYENQILVF